MSGYSRIYCIGKPGGYPGADGLDQITCQIWVGDGDRQWWEAKYFDETLSPLGKLKSLVPRGPDDEDALIDSCLAFAPDLFVDCPPMSVVRHQARELTRIDFHLQPGEIPEGWAKSPPRGTRGVLTIDHL